MQRSTFVFLALAGLSFTVSAQQIPMTVELQQPLSTSSSHQGDPVSARVIDPASLQGDTVTGHVTEVKTGNKFRGEAVLNFAFDTLQHGGTSIPISTQITGVTNSKGQADVDEEGRVIRKTSNVGKAAAGTGLGALIGGIAGGGKGAAIGAGVGAVASAGIIQVAAHGPRLDFAPGSHISLSVKSTNDTNLANLQAANASASQPASPQPALAAETASAATAQAAPATAAESNGQPDLKAIKIDFIPGEKTVFFDDFSDMAEDEPPPHWRVRDGKVELRTGGGIHQLTTVCPAKAELHSSSFIFPKNFTVEVEAAFGGEYADFDMFAWPKDVDGGERPAWVIHVSPGAVSAKGPDDSSIGDKQIQPAAVNTPIKVALWVQEGRARLYVNGERVGDVNQMFIPSEMKPPEHWTIRERCDRAEEGWIGIRSIRVAESAPDFSSMIASQGRYVTHGIHFDTDSDKLQTDSAPVIKAVARGLEKNPNLKLAIEGYTDSTGDAKHNQDLSQRRAEAVKTVLVSQFGVDAGRLTASGLGPAKPIGSNDTPEGRAANRRVEFVKQ